ncbi:hypothetical protein PRIC2_004419 [Phytophthora ramorum]
MTKLAGRESSSGEVKAPFRNDVVDSVASAWEGLSASTISNGFNGILAVPPVDPMFEASSNALAEELDRLQLFDSDVDVNQLRQQVQYLMEWRDLYLTQLFLGRQQPEGDVLDVVEKLVNGFSKKVPNLTSSQRSHLISSQQMADSRNAAMHGLELERGTQIFSHRSWTTMSIRVTYFVEEEKNEDTLDAAEIRRLCGDNNGCVVGIVGIFTARIKNEMIVGFFPLH